jgi:hypothetical protein
MAVRAVKVSSMTLVDGMPGFSLGAEALIERLQCIGELFESGGSLC